MDEPIATSGAAAQRVFLMEAYMYRGRPLSTVRISRARGPSNPYDRQVRADFGFREPQNPRRRMFGPAQEGGDFLAVRDELRGKEPSAAD